jgi:ABC-2 type transport system permease protein
VSLALLFRDELNGFYRSNVMLALWVGMPALSVILYAANPQTGLPVAVFTSLLVGSIGGTLASAMLAVSIINERERHVFDLFVIRPVKRREILVSKFLAVYLCLIVAGLLALGMGIFADYAYTGLFQVISYQSLEGALILLVSMLAISCSAGILIGVVSPSVLVGVILVLYGGNQASAAAILPALLYESYSWFPLVPGAGVSAVLLVGAIVVFNARPL